MIVVLGISHRTAPIEIRERAALPPDLVLEVLAELVAQPSVGEALIVSTCNRVEVLAAGRASPTDGLTQVLAEVEEVLVRRAPLIKNHLYRHSGSEAVTHLFRVASSLDSLVLGEPQILGQVKTGFELAKTGGTIGSHLNRVVSHALKAAKRVRNETTIGEGQVSVPSVAIDLAKQIFGDLSGRRAALIGSGQMGETVAKLLVQSGAQLVILGRNEARVAELAGQMGGEPRSFATLDQTLSEADVIVTTTSAPDFVVDAGAVERVRKRRKGRSLFFIDLAVPRDVDPEIGELDNTFLYNVDDLSQIVAETLSSREAEAERAEEIVRAETLNHERAFSAQQVTPTLLALREQLSQCLSSELEKTLRTRLKHLGDEERKALEIMHEAAIKKVLHPVTRQLRSLASAPETQAEAEQSFAVMSALFELEIQSQARASASPAALKHSNQSTPQTGPVSEGAQSDSSKDNEKKVS